MINCSEWLQSKNSFQCGINFSHLFSGQFATNIDQPEAMIYRAGLEAMMRPRFKSAIQAILL